MLKHLCMTAAIVGLMATGAARAEDAVKDTAGHEIKLREKMEKFRELSPEHREKLKDHGFSGGYFSEEEREKFKNMTEEEKKAFFEERKAKWDAMSDEEKVKAIEEKRAAYRKYSDEKWAAMTDKEKIEYAEKRMKHRGKHWKKHAKDKYEDGGKPEGSGE